MRTTCPTAEHARRGLPSHLMADVRSRETSFPGTLTGCWDWELEQFISSPAHKSSNTELRNSATPLDDALNRSPIFQCHPRMYVLLLGVRTRGCTRRWQLMLTIKVR